MAKKWKCYDCGASNSKKEEWCTSDHHDLGEEVFRLKHLLHLANEKYEEVLLNRYDVTYMTLDEFITDITSAMRDHLKASFNDDGIQKYHPEDLISNASTFMDSAYHVSSVFRARK